ncbi:MAG: hypothetical protein ACE5H3_00970 [Planctomycetota bacterium]
MTSGRIPLACRILLWALAAGAGGAGSGCAPDPEASAGLRRRLSDFRVERLPVALPEPWRREMAAALARGSEISLLDPRAPALARELLLGVSWIDPATVQVELQLPEGLRAVFRPRQVTFRVQREGRTVGVVSDGGVLLPEGYPEKWLLSVPAVPQTPGFELPPPGRRLADPLVRSALNARDEFYALRRETGLDLMRIEREEGFPLEARVPPPLSFVTAGGAEIFWGHPEAARDPLGVPLEVKARRLAAVLRAWPGLRGVGRVVVDRPLLRILDDRGRPLALPGER